MTDLGRAAMVEFDEPRAVETDQPVIRAHPEVTVGRLRNSRHDAAGQIVFGIPDIDEIIPRGIASSTMNVPSETNQASGQNQTAQQAKTVSAGTGQRHEPTMKES